MQSKFFAHPASSARDEIETPDRLQMRRNNTTANAKLREPQKALNKIHNLNWGYRAVKFSHSVWGVLNKADYFLNNFVLNNLP